MNYHFIWKAFNVADRSTDAVYEQTIYGETLIDAVTTWSQMPGDLWEDVNGVAVEITSIKEVE
jgi:hypothetical protein